MEGDTNMSAAESSKLQRERIRKTIRLALPSSGEGDDGNLKNVLKKVFENDLILRNICKYFDLCDLKKFRSICWKWKKASEINFRSRGRIVIDSYEGLLALIDDFERFYSIENEDSSCDIPITALIIKGKDEIKTSVLTDFCGTGLGRFIRDLTLDDIPLVIDGRKSLNGHFDISEMIPRAVKKLRISSRVAGKYQKLCLSMDILQNVDVIDLFDMKLKCCGVAKICPEELRLHCVKFILENGEKEEITLVNKYLDFRNLKKLSLGDSDFELDMSEKDISLDLLSVRSTRNLINWEDSSWTIKKAMFLIENNITNMKIQNLETLSLKIDLSQLPTTLEEANFSRVKRVKAIYPVNLPNLKTMKLKCADDVRARVPFDVSLIPPSVTTLELENNIVIYGQGVFELETLVLQHFNPRALLKSLGTTLEKLKPKYLILSEKVNSYPSAKAELLKIFTTSHFCQHVSIGSEEWTIEARMRMRILQYFFISR